MIFLSCNNSTKDSVEKADSANQARLDRGLAENKIVVDENSSAFLVRAAAMLLEIRVVSDHYRHETVNQQLKDLVGKIVDAHSLISDTVLALAHRKSIVLPADSTIGLKEIAAFRGKGKLVDKVITSYLVNAHEKVISTFENAMLDTKDPDIRSFADKTLPLLRTHLNAAKEMEKSF